MSALLFDLTEMKDGTNLRICHRFVSTHRINIKSPNLQHGIASAHKPRCMHACTEGAETGTHMQIHAHRDLQTHRDSRMHRHTREHIYTHIHAVTHTVYPERKRGRVKSVAENSQGLGSWKTFPRWSTWVCELISLSQEQHFLRGPILCPTQQVNTAGTVTEQQSEQWRSLPKTPQTWKPCFPSREHPAHLAPSSPRCPQS